MEWKFADWRLFEKDNSMFKNYVVKPKLVSVSDPFQGFYNVHLFNLVCGWNSPTILTKILL